MARSARPLSGQDACIMAHRLFPSHLSQLEHVERLDSWGRGSVPDDELPFVPRQATAEYLALREMSQTPLAGLIINSTVQTAFLEGVRAAGSQENLQCYSDWQRNGWDARQIALYAGSLTHGASFGVGVLGRNPLTGEVMPIMRALSARRMSAYYEDDDLLAASWPSSALEVTETFDDKNQHEGYDVTLYDETALYYLHCKGQGWDIGDWTYISHEEQGAGVCPVVRYECSLDLDGRVTSSTEPLIPLLRRIDQDTFYRLTVQRFGAWKVRWIAGLAKPDNDEDAIRQALNLKVEDLLISSSTETKFGTLDATQIEGFIKARDEDMRDLSATSQTPPHHLLGLSSNLQAEALAAAEASLQRKSVQHKTLWGERHEQMFRLTSKLRGNMADAQRYDMQVRWKDMESRSLNQAADALLKLAQGVGVPFEMLWERIPNWTDSDTERAKSLIQDGEFERLLSALEQQQPPSLGSPSDTPRQGQGSASA